MPRIIQTLFWLTVILLSATEISSLVIDSTGRVYSDLIEITSVNFAAEITSWSKSGGKSPFYSTCNRTLYLSGYQIGGTYSRTFSNLPSHDMVALTFRIYSLDNWGTNDRLLITVGSKVYTLTGLVNGRFKGLLNCGSNKRKDFGDIRARFLLFHNTTTLAMQFQPSMGSSSYYGVRDIKIAYGYKSNQDTEYTCYISSNGFTLTNRCNCSDATKYYNRVTRTCVKCNSTCLMTCTDSPTSQCVECKSGFFYNGFMCVQCPAGCSTCNSSTNCITCNTGLYKYSNGTCGVCNAPMNISGSLCISICNSTSFLYWDRTCLRNCSSPLSISFVGNDKLCLYTCTVNNFLFEDKSCSSQCVLPFTNYTFKARNFCKNPCRGPGVYEYDNWTCGLDCNSPNIVFNMGSYNHCGIPCNGSTPYEYQNGSCLSTCNQPFNIQYYSGYPFCNFVCDLMQFLLLNNLFTCSNSCPAPFISTQVSLYRYCSTNCPGSYVLRDGFNCSATCDSPWLPTTTPYLFCDTPCPNQNDFLYPDGTCGPTCDFPMMTVGSPYLQCLSPCLDTEYYHFETFTCIIDCDPPLTTEELPFVSMCYGDLAILLDNITNITDTLPANNTNATLPENDTLPVDNPPDLTNTTDNSNFTNSTDITNSTNGTVDISTNFTMTPNDTNITNTTNIPNSTTIINATNFTNLTNVTNPNNPSSNDTNPQNNNSTTNQNSSTTNSTEPINPIIENGTDINGTDINGTDINGTTSTALSEEIGNIDPSVSLLITKVLQTSATFAATTGGSAAVTSSMTATVFGMIPLNRFMYYTRFFKVDYPYEVKVYFAMMNNTEFLSFGYSLPIPGLTFTPDVFLPSNFKGWGLSANFFENYWKTISTITLSLFFAWISMIGEMFAVRKGYQDLTFLMENLKYMFKWNMGLTIFCSGFDMITLFSSFELRSPANFGNGVSGVSFILCVLILLLQCGALFIIFKLTRGYYNSKFMIMPSTSSTTSPSQVFAEKWKSFRVLYAGFSQNSYLTAGYLLFSLIKNILWTAAVAFLYDNPIAQLGVICGLSFLTLAILIIKKPFLNIVSKYEMPILEIVSLFVHASILALQMTNQQGNTDPENLKLIGMIIIYGSTVFSILTFVSVGVHFIRAMFTSLKIYRAMKRKGPVSLVRMMGIPFMDEALYGDEAMIKRQNTISGLKRSSSFVDKSSMMDKSSSQMPLKNFSQGLKDWKYRITRGFYSSNKISDATTILSTETTPKRLIANSTELDELRETDASPKTGLYPVSPGIRKFRERMKTFSGFNTLKRTENESPDRRSLEDLTIDRTTDRMTTDRLTTDRISPDRLTIDQPESEKIKITDL